MIIEKPFPYGLAAINRLISYAKGLAALSNNVEVLCLKPTEDISDQIRNKDKSGNFEGIKYQYLSGTTIKPAAKIKRILLYLKGFIKAFIYIYSTSQKKGIDVIFMGNSNFPVTFIFFVLSRFLNIKFIHERSEYPFLTSSKSIFQKLQLQIYLKLTLKLFDGLIVITHHLEEYFKPKIKKNARIMILPILVEPERFNKIKSSVQTGKTITYCGSMEGNKDGVPILIEAFGKVAAKYQDVNLVLIGSTHFSSFPKLMDKIKALKIEDKVRFTGRVERYEMPQLLSNADILVLARPESIQAQGGFPTKLGEYLAAGIPVVITRVGTIPLYLKDNKNAFLAEPGSPEKFAERIEYVFANPEKAAAVAREGQKLTQTVFNYKYQAKNIVSFINSL